MKQLKNSGFTRDLTTFIVRTLIVCAIGFLIGTGISATILKLIGRI